MERLGARLAAVLPGLILAVVLAVSCRILIGVLPEKITDVVGEPVLGLLVGLGLGQFFGSRRDLHAGFRFAYVSLLPLAIVLLGARFSFQRIAGMGIGVLVLIVSLILLAIILTTTLSRLGRISPKLGLLVGLGTAICGNTAITVSAPVIGARDEEITFAIATNTLFGTLAVVLYPILGHWLGLTEAFFGLWSGTAVNDTSQVIAVGFSFGEQAGELATMVKLTRNALMGVVILILGWVYASQGKGMSFAQKLRCSVPAFLIGFLMMALLQTFGLVDQLGEWLGRPLVSDLMKAAKFLILIALIGIGWNTRLDKIRELGWKPMLIGLVAASLVSLTSFWAISLFLV